MSKGSIVRLALLIGSVFTSLAVNPLAVPSAAAASPQTTASFARHSSAVKSGVAAPARPGTRNGDRLDGGPPSSTPVRPETLPSRYQFWNLQLNLCNSGVAGCYEGGQAIPEAQDLITSWAPDVVTLNEICLPDVRDQLFPTMGQRWPGDWVFWVFMPAWNVNQDAPYQCTDGRGEFGNAIIGHVLADDWAGMESFGGIYQWQDSQTNEWRSWACAYAIDNYYGCATHLASGNSTAAFRQCEELLSGVVPSLWSDQGVYRPSVVGGDFNLRYAGSPDIQDCVPGNWFRKGDGDVQHWFMTDDFAFDFTREFGMDHTDHPGWLVALTAP